DRKTEQRPTNVSPIHENMRGGSPKFLFDVVDQPILDGDGTGHRVRLQKGGGGFQFSPPLLIRFFQPMRQRQMVGSSRQWPDQKQSGDEQAGAKGQHGQQPASDWGSNPQLIVDATRDEKPAQQGNESPGHSTQDDRFPQIAIDGIQEFGEWSRHIPS